MDRNNGRSLEAAEEAGTDATKPSVKGEESAQPYRSFTLTLLRSLHVCPLSFFLLPFAFFLL